MALRANVLAKGYLRHPAQRRSSACSTCSNRRVHPRVPSRGSVGASGDLAPLAHLSLVLIGEGQAWVGDGPALRTGRDALAAAGLSPVTLGPKEGLALINGTQPSTAVGALAVAGAERLARAADVAAALSIDALRGSVHPFDARIHDARPYAGQVASAGNIRALLAGSAINKSHEHCGRVQDAYSLRCAAQVHGAAREALTFARTLLDDRGQRRHRQPDGLHRGTTRSCPAATSTARRWRSPPTSSSIALAQLATISERRSDRLVNPALSDLPAFLTADSGLQSGYMMAQVTAAALTSEIKTLAHPASVDTIPTSANREDHVSMSMGAALKATQALELATRVIAIEILCACQAIDLLAPLTTAPALAARARPRARGRAERSPSTVRRRPTSRRSPRSSRTDRWSRQSRKKSSKKFFNFKLTTRAYVLRLLPSAHNRRQSRSTASACRAAMRHTRFQHDEHPQPPCQRAARRDDHLQGMATGSGAPHADEQSRP